MQRIYQPSIVKLLQVFLIIGVTFQSRWQTANVTDAENVEGWQWVCEILFVACINAVQFNLPDNLLVYL
jgi:hypothetical protein